MYFLFSELLFNAKTGHILCFFTSKINQIASKTVEEFYNELIQHYNKTDKPGNARTYKYSLGSIKRFCSKGDILFSDIDVASGRSEERV